MKLRLFGKLFASSIAATFMVGLAGTSPVSAQAGHDHASSSDDHSSSALVAVVRQATERFRDPAVAIAEGYGLQFGCVTGPDAGAMGMHFVNFPLVADGEIDATRPEIVIYEPLPDGRLRLIGADFLVLATRGRRSIQTRVQRS